MDILVTNPGSGNSISSAFNTAQAGAVDGDVLVLPAGDFSQIDRLTITKLIGIRSVSNGATTLRRPNSMSDATLNSVESIFRFATFSNKTSGIIIKGINFVSKTPVSGSTARDIAIDMNYAYDFIIESCTFQYFGSAAVNVYHRNNLAMGLIHSNTFTDCQKGDGLGYGYGVQVNGEGSSVPWLQNVIYGDYNKIYIEDNVFTHCRHAIASAGGALVVGRYNTVNQNWINNPSEPYTHFLDSHSSRGTADVNYYGTKYTEFYNNTLTNTVFDDGTTIVPGQDSSRLVELAIAIRSGEGVIYNNVISGTQHGIGIYADATPFGSTFPMKYCPGEESGLIRGASNLGTSSFDTRGDFWIWGNSFTNASSLGLTGFSEAIHNYNSPTGAFVEERDYHLSPKPGYVAAGYPHFRRK